MHCARGGPSSPPASCPLLSRSLLHISLHTRNPCLRRCAPQESNKVKELAMLYKAGGDPRASATQLQRSADAASGAEPAEGRPAAADLRSSKGDEQLASIWKRLQHFGRAQGADAAAASAAAGAPQQPRQEQQMQQPAAASARQKQQGQQAQAAAPAAPSPAPAAARKPAAAAARPAGGSRLPAPPARASRLRPPTSSSGYFSNASTDSRWVGAGRAAGAFFL